MTPDKRTTDILEAKAREFCFASDSPNGDLPHDTVHKLMADFATQAIREREVEIADELEEGHSCESNECWTCDYLSQLRSNK